MVRISKKKVERPVVEAMSDHLLSSIVHARTKRDAYALLTELLGKEERIMLSKRYATVAMLATGYSFSQIQKFLKVSEVTVITIWQDTKDGRYNHLVNYARNNRRKFEGDSLMDLLDSLLRAGIMPPRAGKGRWDYLKRSARTSEYFD
jgi:uncharacterized protein YerC